MNMSSSRSPSRGFSLIELLTVIAILGALCALVAVKAKEWTDRSRDAQCIQRLRTIQQATLTFAAENQGRLPLALGALEGGGTSPNPPVYDQLSPYLGNPEKYIGAGKIGPQWRKVWWCPRTEDKEEWTEETLGYNVALGAPTLGFPERTLGSISMPSKTALVSCITSNYVVFPWMAYVTPSKGPSNGGQLPDWHSGGCNVAFMDGHVAVSQKINQNDPRSRWWNVDDPEAP